MDLMTKYSSDFSTRNLLVYMIPESFKYHTGENKKIAIPNVNISSVVIPKKRVRDGKPKATSTSFIRFDSNRKVQVCELLNIEARLIAIKTG